MDWSQPFIPVMRLEPRFGDRIVPAFCERPKSVWAMVADAMASNPDGEALVCGERRMSWREVGRQSAQIAAGTIVVSEVQRREFETLHVGDPARERVIRYGLDLNPG